MHIAICEAVLCCQVEFATGSLGMNVQSGDRQSRRPLVILTAAISL